MNFLVILVCLTVNYLWLKDFDRFDDGWFFKFRCEIESAFQSKSADVSDKWRLSTIIIYGAPLVILIAALLLASGRAFGIPTMVLHILVLLVAFDRTQPGQLAADFMAKWGSNDYEAAKLYLMEELKAEDLSDVKQPDVLLDYFCQNLIYRCFEKMFVMFFWYMVAGPVGVLLCYVSYQLRDSHHDNQAAELVEMIDTIIWALEWIPMRLLALTFSLAGNFVQCFESVKKSFWDFSTDTDNGALLYAYSGCALSGFAESDELAESAEKSEAGSLETMLGKRRVAGLQALLERSQAIWLAVLALITVFGL